MAPSVGARPGLRSLTVAVRVALPAPFEVCRQLRECGMARGKVAMSASNIRPSPVCIW
jgi:hypothetical protein